MPQDQNRRRFETLLLDALAVVSFAAMVWGIREISGDAALIIGGGIIFGLCIWKARQGNGNRN